MGVRLGVEEGGEGLEFFGGRSLVVFFMVGVVAFEHSAVGSSKGLAPSLHLQHSSF